MVTWTPPPRGRNSSGFIINVFFCVFIYSKTIVLNQSEFHCFLSGLFLPWFYLEQCCVEIHALHHGAHSIARIILCSGAEFKHRACDAIDPSGHISIMIWYIITNETIKNSSLPFRSAVFWSGSRRRVITPRLNVPICLDKQRCHHCYIKPIEAIRAK